MSQAQLKPEEVEAPPLVPSLTALPTLTPCQLEDVEDRKFRRWMMKTLLYTAVFCVVVLVTAIAVVGVKTGQFPDNGWISKLIDLAQDFMPIAKFVFGISQ